MKWSNYVTFARILAICTTMGALEEIMDIYQWAFQNDFALIVVVSNALIHMYAKFGRVPKGYELFDKMHDVDI